jgi:hypothetical protein
MNLSMMSFFVGFLLGLAQLLAALPWMIALLEPGQRAQIRAGLFRPVGLGLIGFALLLAFILPAIFLLEVTDLTAVEIYGRVYAAILQMQLTADAFVLFFPLLLLVWPKGGAIALAAFREGVRQPMYLLLTGFALVLLGISPFVPYFTFGEDHIMVKELGYDTIMLAALAFGVPAASIFLNDEIEGRTALTVMSKPVSRRQFLLGKHLGILLAVGLMFAILGHWFEGVLLFKPWWDKADTVQTTLEGSLPFGKAPPWVNNLVTRIGLQRSPSAFLTGVGFWVAHTVETLPGLVLSYCQVLVLVSIAVALATRLPMVVNLSIILALYFMAHLTPVLVSIGQQARTNAPGSAVGKLLAFVSQLFDTLLPGLDFFKVGPTLISDAPPPAGPFWIYIASVACYAFLYSAIALLLGLIFFEDRDLA